MKHFDIPNINSSSYWDEHQTATDFGLRQEKYKDLVGSGDKICELGCGLSPFLSGVDFKEKVGIDFSETTLLKASELNPTIDYYPADVTKVPFHDNYFDAVVAGEVIEHLEEPQKLLDEMERICKPNGIIVLSTPNLEFEDPEHLWEFDEEYFIEKGFFVETIDSERFEGRSYIFAHKRV